LVSINCAALPESLLESELFGYEKGAFTGASTSYEGKLKLADRGTVFFDEIGDMSLVAQAKILRAIESKEVYRLGGKGEVSLDFRVIAATNQDLESMIANSEFRKDLFYRLNVARIHIPPLREHKEDIPRLVRYFLEKLNLAFDASVETVQNQAMQLLIHYDWPGNVRELRNILESTYINHPSHTIELSHLPKWFSHLNTERDATGSEDDQEREALIVALTSSNWNKSKAAEELHWSRMTLYRKMKKYHIANVCPKKLRPTDS
jgi:transcriptional regulator with PAS, ATPase and Fis domain